MEVAGSTLPLSWQIERDLRVMIGLLYGAQWARRVVMKRKLIQRSGKRALVFAHAQAYCCYSYYCAASHRGHADRWRWLTPRGAELSSAFPIRTDRDGR